MILGEIRKHARLDPCSLDDVSVSVNQHHGFTGAMVYITNANPVRVEEFVFCRRHSRQQTDQEKQKAPQEQTHTFLLSSWPNVISEPHTKNVDRLSPATAQQRKSKLVAISASYVELSTLSRISRPGRRRGNILSRHCTVGFNSL